MLLLEKYSAFNRIGKDLTRAFIMEKKMYQSLTCRCHVEICYRRRSLGSISLVLSGVQVTEEQVNPSYTRILDLDSYKSRVE